MSQHQREFLMQVRQFDTEITPYATSPVLDHPIQLARIAESKESPDTFVTTTTCYDDAMDFAEGVMRHHGERNKSAKHWRLVHGILTDEDNETWGHAWLEHGNIVYESRWYRGQRIFSMTDKAEWLAVWQPQYVHAYTLPEAVRNMRTSKMGNAGPWDERILAVANHYSGEV